MRSGDITGEPAYVPPRIPEANASGITLPLPEGIKAPEEIHSYTKEQVWFQAYCAAVSRSNSTGPRAWADEALKDFEKRFGSLE